MRGSLLLSSSIELQKLMPFSGFFLEKAVHGAVFWEWRLNGGFLFSINGVLSCAH